MPKMNDFSLHMGKQTQKVLKASEAAIKKAAITGSGFMKEVIEKNPLPLTAWHKGKNEANGFALGARIGSKVAYGGYNPDPNSGLMLSSVETGSVERSKNAIEVKFGWVNEQRDYFIKQDTGKYRTGGIGMGLLNKASSSDGLSAYLRSREVMISEMKKAGFGVSGSESL